jgi:hypothetical protein
MSAEQRRKGNGKKNGEFIRKLVNQSLQEKYMTEVMFGCSGLNPNLNRSSSEIAWAELSCVAESEKSWPPPNVAGS